ADRRGDAGNERPRTGRARVDEAPRYSSVVHVRIYGQRNHHGRHAGKRTGVPAKAVFSGGAGAEGARSPESHANTVDSFKCYWGGDGAGAAAGCEASFGLPMLLSVSTLKRL